VLRNPRRHHSGEEEEVIEGDSREECPFPPEAPLSLDDLCDPEATETPPPSPLEGAAAAEEEEEELPQSPVFDWTKKHVPHSDHVRSRLLRNSKVHTTPHSYSPH
jgi:hypothetical protein